jgi:MFS family permease
LWLVFGLLAGIGLENKLSVLFLGVGVGAGLLLAREWRHLRDPRLWIGGGIAMLLFAPHLLWQQAHGWPTPEFVRHATENKNLVLSPLAYLREQMLMMNPLALPLWLAGLVDLLVARNGRRWRALGWTWPVAFVVMAMQHGKPYYLAPIYPLLFAGGGIVLERIAKRRAAVGAVAVALLAVSGLALAPLAKPLLSEDEYVRYARALGMAPGSDERHALARLPQYFADMHGWPELAAAVGAVAATLPPDERVHACVFGQNYGEAAAIDFFGPAQGAPRAISGHNNYWLWGPRGCDGSVVIVIGGDRADLDEVYAEVTDAGRFECTDCMPYENGQTLWIGRKPKVTIESVWPRIKHYD